MNRFNIREKADYVGTLRAVNVVLMELLARWTPTTPEMEVKVLMGRHLWDFAQHADWLGRRAFELRAPLHYNLPPSPEFAKWLQDVAANEPTADRLAAFYEGALSAIGQRHSFYLDHTDHLQDEPTVRIIQRILSDHQRIASEHAALLKELPALAKNAAQWSKAIADRQGSLQFVRVEAAELAAAKGV